MCAASWYDAPGMKKLARKVQPPVRPIQDVDLERVRGGITAMDDWEAPIANATGKRSHEPLT